MVRCAGSVPANPVVYKSVYGSSLHVLPCPTANLAAHIAPGMLQVDFAYLSGGWSLSHVSKMQMSARLRGMFAAAAAVLL